MDAMIAFCGLACDECPALLATQANDDAKRAELAHLWSKPFNADIKPADINCEGCRSDGTILFCHCRVCKIRECAKQKRVNNCAYCDEYPCKKLEMVLDMMPDARKRLDQIKSTL